MGREDWSEVEVWSEVGLEGLGKAGDWSEVGLEGLHQVEDGEGLRRVLPELRRKYDVWL